MENSKTLKLNTLKIKEFIWPKTNQWQKIVICSLGALLVFCSIIYLIFWGYDRAYAGKYFPGITIRGEDIGGKTKVQVTSLLQSKIAGIQTQNIKINVNGEIKNTNLNDLGINLEIVDSLEKAYSFTHQGAIWQRIPNSLQVLFNGKDFNLVILYDEAKLSDQLKTLAGDNYREAKNATVAVSGEDIRVISEEVGQTVDINSFKNNINDYIFGQSQVMIKLEFLQTKPTINSQEVEMIVKDMEKIVFPTIAFRDLDKGENYTASPEEIARWIILKADYSNILSIQFSDEKIKTFILNLALKTDQKMINRKIKEKDSSIITEGQEGKTLNQEKLLNDLKELLIDRKIGKSTVNTIELTITATPKGEEKVAVWEANPAGGGTPGLSEGKYVEVNLSEQRMYLFNGSSAEGSFIVSTGKWSMPTPEGIRYIEDKTPRAWSSKYKLYMPWWNDIGGGYGIHELPEWPGGAKEGEAHLGIPVSHGCIRLGVGAAEIVYNWAGIGTPVFIHK